MSPLEFDHELNKRLLRFRQVLNRSAQCMNHCELALQRAARDAKKNGFRIERKTNELANLMRSLNL